MDLPARPVVPGSARFRGAIRAFTKCIPRAPVFKMTLVGKQTPSNYYYYYYYYYQ